MQLCWTKERNDLSFSPFSFGALTFEKIVLTLHRLMYIARLDKVAVVGEKLGSRYLTYI